MQCAVVTWWQSRDDAALIHSPNLPIIRILKKYMTNDDKYCMKFMTETSIYDINKNVVRGY